MSGIGKPLWLSKKIQEVADKDEAASDDQLGHALVDRDASFLTKRRKYLALQRLLDDFFGVGKPKWAFGKTPDAPKQNRGLSGPSPIREDQNPFTADLHRSFLAYLGY
jgi:hypothetical protein